MTAIGGFWAQGKGSARASCARILAGQKQFGTREAMGGDDVLVIGRRLHPILPQDRFDSGPVEHGPFQLVADVRLDNRDELVRSLNLNGRDADRMPDSAILLQALISWQTDALDRLAGEFAFALWDSRERRLTLGRDIFGLRPLHFVAGGGFTAFASMPSGLHALPDVPYEADTEFIADRIALSPWTGSRTYFQGIERVEPGHFVEFRPTGRVSRSYWNPKPPDPRETRSPEEFVEGLRSVFEEAARAQLRGAGGVIASQLSGGLDSSAVTATVAKLAPDRKIAAFTAVPRAGFNSSSLWETLADEGALAAQTARLYPNIDHILVPNADESPLEWLDHNFHFQQRPMSNAANAVWGQAINRAARDRGAKLLFKGGLGNLTVSYNGLDWLPTLASQGRLWELSRHLRALRAGGTPSRTLASRAFAPFVSGRFWSALRGWTGRTRSISDYAAVLPEAVERRHQFSAHGAMDWNERPTADPFATRLSALRTVDGGAGYKGALAEWGLSIRDPTSDKRVVEYCLGVPFAEFVRGGKQRALARSAFSDRLPPQVAGGTQRGLQSADWHERFIQARGDIVDEIAAIERCDAVAQSLDLDWISQAMEEWPEDGWATEKAYKTYRIGLLRAVAAGHFIRKVAGTN